MATGVSLKQEVRPMSFGLSLYALFVLCALLLFPLHEFSHYLSYRFLGIDVQMTLNTASPKDQSQRKAIAELAGPLLNLVIASAATVAYHSSHRQRQWWAALGLASAMMRLVIYVLVVVAAIVTGSGLSLGNDEPIAAHLWGLPSLMFVGVLTVPFAVIVWTIVRTLDRSWGRRALHMIGLGLTMLCVGVFVGNVLDPWLFPNR